MNTKRNIKIHRQSKVGFFAKAAATFAMLFCSLGLQAHESAMPISLRVELDRAILPANKTEKAIIKVSLDGLKRERAESRPPINLVIVLDRSTSMNGDKIVQAKEAAIEALNRLAAEDIFSLVTFDSVVETVIPATRVGNGEALEAKIRQIQPRGMTALYGGVSQGTSELRKNIEDSRYIHRIILLSDGQANVGPRTAEELGRLGAALVKEGISVTTIGLGLGYDEDLMTRLALRSDGNTYFVEGTPDLARIFTAELGDVLNIVARRVVIKIEFPSNIRPIRFIGREGTINGQYGEVTLNQIYGGQEKYALVEVEVPAHKENEECTVVNAKVVFEDPVSQKTGTLSATQDARFSANEETVLKSANQNVQIEYAKNIAAAKQEEAIALVDAGKQEEAAKVMKESAKTLNSLGNSYGISAVVDISANLTNNAESIEKHGFGADYEEKNKTRKTLRTQNITTQNQQIVSPVPTK